MRPLGFVVPGRLDQLTGGYLFDRHLVEGLRARGRAVSVLELDGAFPDADDMAREAARTALAALPDDALVVIDGLALPGFETCLAAHAHRLRLIGFVHHPLSSEAGAAPASLARHAALEARLWPMLRGIVCPSAHTAREVIAAGIAPDRVAVAPPGTERPAAAQGQAAAAQPAIVDERGRAVHLLAVGTVTPRKGHLALVEALADLHDLEWRLDCVGSLERDPHCAAAVRRAIETHRLGGRIALLGELPAAGLDAAWRRADAFVLASLHEGYGMAFAEALVRGLPIVATRAGALPETVPADASLQVPPGDVGALRGALRSLIGDAALRATLAAGARRAGAALPDWPMAVDRWAGAVDRLAA
ncbi:MAG: glycosyltransferase family 4 protein [Burkholderiales bacterium]|nr:glycosyltransferase family 4 protein [Burkholderiales bacterium]